MKRLYQWHYWHEAFSEYNALAEDPPLPYQLERWREAGAAEEEWRVVPRVRLSAEWPGRYWRLSDPLVGEEYYDKLLARERRAQEAQAELKREWAKAQAEREAREAKARELEVKSLMKQWELPDPEKASAGLYWMLRRLGEM